MTSKSERLLLHTSVSLVKVCNTIPLFSQKLKGDCAFSSLLIINGIKLRLQYTFRPNKSPRGPGFWKFNNTLLKDENYTGEICELIPQIREKNESLNDKRLVWELIKMEISDHTVSFTKRKARAAFKRETEISKPLEILDYKICHSDNLSNIDDILNESLKIEMQTGNI